MANYKIYAPNGGHSCDYGVDFFEGVAFTSSDSIVKWCRSKGYYAEKTSDSALTEVDKMAMDTIKNILASYNVTLPTSELNKREYSLALDKCLSTAVAASGNIASTTFTTGVTVTYAKSAAAESGTVPTESATGLGTEITVKSNPLTAPTGKKFSCWTDGSGNEFIAGDKVRLGAASLTLTATWVDA